MDQEVIASGGELNMYLKKVSLTFFFFFFKPSPFVSRRRIGFGSIPLEINHYSLGPKPNKRDKNFFDCPGR